jgi:hypothetical protein
MAAWLATQGHHVNRKRVQRLMRLLGLAAIYQSPNTSKPAAAHKIYPYLLRGLAIDRVNQVWCSDVTYIPMAQGFLYLVVIMDWVSRDRWAGRAFAHPDLGVLTCTIHRRSVNGRSWLRRRRGNAQESLASDAKGVRNAGREALGVEFAPDSPLEGDGFEPSVPREGPTRRDGFIRLSGGGSEAHHRRSAISTARSGRRSPPGP